MLQRTTIPLHRLGCSAAARRRVEKELESLPGVATVYVNPLTEMAYVEYDPARTDPEQCIAAAARSGYLESRPVPDASAMPPMGDDAGRRRGWRAPALTLLVPCLLAVVGVAAVVGLSGSSAGALPLIVVVACLLFHLVGHGGGHGSHGRSAGPADRETGRSGRREGHRAHPSHTGRR